MRIRAVNEVIISGNLAFEPSVHKFENGGRVANFTIAAQRSSKSTDFPAFKAWDEIADALEAHGAVACGVYVEGRLQTERFTDKNDDSKKHKATYVHVKRLQIVDAHTGAVICDVTERPREDEELEEAAAV